jgi:hypothetical protein
MVPPRPETKQKMLAILRDLGLPIAVEARA